MVDNIKFRELRGRIDNILLQLSGLAPSTKDRIGLLESLFKEFRHEYINTKEETHVLKLFENALKKDNMVKGTTGIGYEERVTYDPSQAFLNEIEMELRRLLGLKGFYQITREEVDYQLGEF